jgi:hypothetical protein
MKHTPLRERPEILSRFRPSGKGSNQFPPVASRSDPFPEGWEVILGRSFRKAYRLLPVTRVGGSSSLQIVVASGNCQVLNVDLTVVIDISDTADSAPI